MPQATGRSVFPGNKLRLGLIAGKGDLPALLAQAAEEQGHDLFVLAIRDNTDPQLVNAIPHQWIEMAEIASALDVLRAEQVTHLVMAGGLKRPPLKAFRPSPLTTKILGRIGKAFFGGDDTLLKAIVQVFEEEGFTVIGADDLLVDLLTPSGLLTCTLPSAQALEDMATGILLLKEFGKRDEGQAILIRHGELIGAETADGTDALIRRYAAKDNLSGYHGILVKGSKPGQEARVDLPSVGPETIRNLHASGFAGLALEAGKSLMIRKTEMIRLADELGLFVEGIDAT
jgi:UDP-2,3-diacylglucosamine hydrolase